MKTELFKLVLILAIGSGAIIFQSAFPQTASKGFPGNTYISYSNDQLPEESDFGWLFPECVDPDIDILPGSWHYGVVAPGSHSNVTFIIKNKGSAVLIVKSINLTGGDSSQFNMQNGDSSFGLAPDSTHYLVVRFAPTSLGTKTTTLRIGSNDPDENPFDIVLTGTGGSLPPHWQIPALTRPVSTVILPVSANPNIEGTPLAYGDYAGVFTPTGLCCGYSIWDGEGIAITVGGDNQQTPEIDGFETGELITYRVYRPEQQKEWTTVMVSYSQGTGYFSWNAIMVLNKFDVFDLKTIEIPLGQGWNMFSINLDLDDDDIEAMFLAIIDKLAILKNCGGGSWIPDFGINTILNFNVLESYLIYMKQPASLIVTGKPLPPDTPIHLPPGWSCPAYLPDKSIDAAIALSSLSGKLIIAKDCSGHVYIPDFEINTIGNMQPGQGYQIYLTEAGTLIYPSGALSSGRGDLAVSDNTAQSKPKHFPFTPRTGQSATLVIPKSIQPAYSDGASIEPGDEIAVYNANGECCGALVWQGTNAALTLWGDNDQTELTDGLTDGEMFRLRVWRKSVEKEYPVRFTSETSASGIYRKDGFFVLTECVAQTSLTAVDAASHSIPTEFRLLQNYPNPFNPETTIEFHLPQPAEVNLTIFDLHGKIVRQLGRASLPAGIQTIRWDGKNEFDRLVASGIYVCRIEARSAAGEHSFTDAKKMILMK